MKRSLVVFVALGLLAGLVGCSDSSDEVADLKAELNDVVAEIDALKEDVVDIQDDLMIEYLTDLMENYEGDPIDGGRVDTEDLDGPFLTFIHEGECASDKYVTCIRLSKPLTVVQLIAYPNEWNNPIYRGDCYAGSIPYHLRPHSLGVGGLFQQAIADDIDGGREEGEASTSFLDPADANEWHVAYCPYVRVNVWTE